MTDVLASLPHHPRELPSLPRLFSERVRLRPVTPQDYPFLYALSLDPELRFRWRFRGEQPGYEEFVRSLGATVFSQYVIMHAPNNNPIGLVVCYQANRHNKNAYIGVQGTNTAHNRGLLIEAAELFIEYLFLCFGFKKLYAECPEFNLQYFQSLVGWLFHQEGVLRQHECFMDRWWDVHLLAIYQEVWRQRRHGFKERLTTTPAALNDQTAGSGMEFGDFAESIRSVMKLGDLPLTADARLMEDLSFDSIQIYELLSVIEEFGSVIPDNSLAELRTLGELHFLYLQHNSWTPKTEKQGP